MRLLVSLCFLGMACTAGAQSPTRAEVMQKEALVRRLVDATPEGKAAGALHARALEDVQRGEYAAADARLREAIRTVQLARRGSAQSSDEAGRYAMLASSVALMRATYAAHAGPREDAQGTLLAEADASLLQARRFQGAGNLREAVRTLETAEQALAYGLRQQLDAVTVNYAPRFGGPREEYEHGVSRYRSYAALVPAAVHQLRPAPAARVLVERHVASGNAALATAEQAAASGRWDSALAALEDATQSLQRALGAAGLALPEESP